MAPWRAITVGLFVVNGPVALLLFVPSTVVWWLNGALQTSSPHDPLILWIALSFFCSFVGAWLWWSFTIARWRVWAYERVTDIHKLKQMAVTAGLTWPAGSIFGRTEIKSKELAAREAELLKLRMTPLDRITERVTRNGEPDDADTPFPLLTLEEFFEGNDVTGSIGCNLVSAPTPSQFYEILRSIRDKEDVANVFVQVTAFDDPEWPFSDTVWIMTSSPENKVRSWFPDELSPDEVWSGWLDGQEYEPVHIPSGMEPVACWWD
jgi:hypothetical protein